MILSRKFSSEKALRGSIAARTGHRARGRTETEICRIERPRIGLLSFRGVNGVPQACIKSSQLGSAPEFQAKFFQGFKMDNVAKISAEAVPAVANNLMVNVMAVICGLALVVFACMATADLDMSAGFF